MPEIVFDCERMKYQNTGLYHYCLNLGKKLEEHSNEDEKLFFYSPGHEQGWSFETRNHIKQHSWHKLRLPTLTRFDIWHATYQNTQYLPLRNKKIRVVLSIHDLNFLYDEKKSILKKQKYLRHLQQLINRADIIICVSEFSKSDVLNNCNTGNKPIYVIHNGTNLLEQPELSPESYRPAKPFLFSVGVIQRKKNFHVLMPLLKANPMELLIAGRPDDHQYISQLREESVKWGVEENVRLLGTISEKEKSWYYNNCRAFALPSISEGFGLPVTEAMSCGKPLFLSNCTALPEIAGDVSFYFQDFNPEHMNEVFRTGMHMYSRNGLSERIRERGKNFDWNRSALQYLEVYRSLY